MSLIHYKSGSRAAISRRSTTLRACPGLVEAIVDGLYKTAVEVDPGRFHQPPQEFVAFAADNFNVDDDLDKWQNVFDLTDAMFKRTSYKSIVLAHSDSLWGEIAKLVPWHSIERIQLALQPALHRFPRHVLHTHRGSALLYNDGTRQIVTEDLGDLRFPKGRFHKPVNIGIFWFGMALPPEQLLEQPQQASASAYLEDDPLKRADLRDSDITFKNADQYPVGSQIADLPDASESWTPSICRTQEVDGHDWPSMLMTWFVAHV